MAATLSILPHIRRLIDLSSPDLGSDAALLSRFVQARDEAAFGVLVARHGPMVHRLCRRVLDDAHAAEDVVQAAFLVLARKAAGLRQPQTLAAWLHGVAYRLALKAQARQVRRRQVETRHGQASPPAPPPDPLAEVSARELLTILDAELQRLPERYRLPLILCCLEGRSQPEAARLLGWTAGSVKGRLERGRAKLHQRLLRRGLTLPAALLALEAERGTTASRLPAELSASVMRTAATAIPGSVAMKMKLALVLVLMLGLVTGGAGWLARGGRPPLVLSSQPGADAPRSPKAERPARTDRYGDPLPPGAIARLGTMRLRAGFVVFCLPGGKTFLSLAPEEDKMVVCVWRMSTGELLRRFEITAPGAEAVALSADGTLLATSVYDRPSATSRISFWDRASGRRKGEWAAIGGFVRALAFAPDGKTIATANGDQTLRLWDRDTATELRRCQGARDQWLSLVFSPDGKVLASASGTRRSVQLWDAATGRALHTLGDGKGRTSAIAFSPDGKTLATGAYGDKVIRLWDARRGKEIRQLPVEWRTETVAFSPDGKTVAAGGLLVNGQLSSLNPIHLWDVSSGREVRRFSGHVFKVSSLAFSPKGEKLISAGNFTLHVWDVATGKDGVPLAEHESYVESVAFSPTGRFLATGSLDGTIRLWKPTAGKPARVFEGGTQPSILQVAFAPDGRALASAEHDGSLRLWDVATGRQTRQIQVGEDHYSPSFAYSPDGRTLAVWHQDATIRLLDAATGKEQRRLTGGARFGTFLCFSPDGGTLASMSASYGPANGVLQLWEIATGRETRKWEIAQPGAFFRAVFSPDGRTVMGGINTFSSANGEIKRFFHVHHWDVATGEHRSFATPEQATVFCLAISPDGRMLAWGDAEGSVTLWDLAAGQVRRRLKGQYSYIRSLAFSPEGERLASGSADTTVLLWDVTGRPAAGHAGALSAERLRALWDDLASKDAGKAFAAIGLLSSSAEQAVPLLKSKVRPAPAPADRRQMARLIADLDSEQFAVRRQAMAELRRLGERAEPGLREARQGKRTLEARKRIDELLEGVRASLSSPDNLRTLRAVEVLEHIGTAEARAVLQALAEGAAEARLTREAKASLERLDRRLHPKP